MLAIALLVVSIAPAADPAPLGADVLALLGASGKERRQATARITADFDVARVPMVLEALPFGAPPEITRRVWRWLETGADRSFRDQEDAFEWLWSQDYTPAPDYLAFKSALYGSIDPRFSPYFRPGPPARIRMDEVRWGGVRQDGIPPLRDPWIETVAEATWLHPDDVVFGVEIAGEARAFPKRILAWHELATDRIGGVAVAAVYCTLCGSMIVYGTEVDGVAHQLGTSGFLYRSNKLMYDAATSSLWSTLSGTPVVGPLVEADIALPMYPVVTTTWGAWRERHPDSRVLSRTTGHDRDYGEGVAYRAYFATDQLMFSVPRQDPRLANKAEVVALRSAGESLALSVAYLARHPVHHDRVGDTDVVVLTDPSGASRVFAAEGVRFATFDGDRGVDMDGGSWSMSEGALARGERQLQRVPAHRAFWFGWVSAWPQTRLVR